MRCWCWLVPSCCADLPGDHLFSISAVRAHRHLHSFWAERRLSWTNHWSVASVNSNIASRPFKQTRRIWIAIYKSSAWKPVRYYSYYVISRKRYEVTVTVMPFTCKLCPYRKSTATLHLGNSSFTFACQTRLSFHHQSSDVWREIPFALSLKFEGRERWKDIM